MARHGQAAARLLAAGAWAIAWAVAGSAGAQPADGPPALVPDRPDSSTGIQIVPAGHVQVEGGMTLSRADGITELDVGELMVRVPFSARIEARAQVFTVDESWGKGSAHGLVGPLVDLKWKLVDGEATDFGVVAGTSLPIGSASERSAHLQPYGVLALDQQLSGTFSVTLNAGVAAASGGGATVAQLSGGASLAWQASAKAGLYLEGFAWARAGTETPAEELVDGGLQLLVGERVMLDARVGVTFGKESHGVLAGVGASVIF